MVSVRQVLFSERHMVAELHPELHRQCPQLLTPYLADATDYPDDFPYIFYILEDGAIASYINCFCDILWREGQQYKWAWNANLLTHPEFRGRGLAQKIVEHQVSEFTKRGFVWGGTFSSDSALRLYDKLGFTIVGAAPRMCLLRNPSPFLAHHRVSGTLARVVSGLYRPVYGAAGIALFRQRKFRKKHSLEQIDVQELARIQLDHPVKHGNRAHWRDDPALLRAKMDVRKSDEIALVRDSSGQPILFFLWRVRETAERPIKEKYSGVRMFSVMDFGYLSEPEAPEALIEAAIGLFHQTDADLLEIISSPPALASAARRHGFLPLGSGMSFTFKAPPHHPLESLRTDVADWELTHYSGDGYSFE